jgi:hypothetical protein
MGCSSSSSSPEKSTSGCDDGRVREGEIAEPCRDKEASRRGGFTGGATLLEAEVVRAPSVDDFSSGLLSASRSVSKTAAALLDPTTVPPHCATDALFCSSVRVEFVLFVLFVFFRDFLSCLSFFFFCFLSLFRFLLASAFLTQAAGRPSPPLEWYSRSCGTNTGSFR